MNISQSIAFGSRCHRGKNPSELDPDHLDEGFDWGVVVVERDSFLLSWNKKWKWNVPHLPQTTAGEHVICLTKKIAPIAANTVHNVIFTPHSPFEVELSRWLSFSYLLGCQLFAIQCDDNCAIQCVLRYHQRFRVYSLQINNSGNYHKFTRPAHSCFVGRVQQILLFDQMHSDRWIVSYNQRGG